MSEALTNRLDKVENEIRILLMLQKKPESKSCKNSSESKKSQKRRPKSAIDVSRKLAIAQQKKRQTEIYERRSISSTGVSRQSSSSRAPSQSSPSSPSRGSPVRSKTRSTQKNRSSSRGSEKKIYKHESKKTKIVHKQNELPVYCIKTKQDNCEKKTSEMKLGFEIEKRKILEEEVSNLKELVEELNASRSTALTVCQQWRDKYNHMKSHRCSCKETWKDYKAEKAQLTATLEEERSKLRKAMGDLQNSDKQLQSYMQACQKYDDLLNATKEKNKCFENLTGENNALVGRCQAVSQELEVMKEKYEQLQNTNQAFAKDVLNRCKCFETATAKADKSLQRVKTENEKLQAALKDLTDLKKASDAKIKKETEISCGLKKEVERLQNTINKFKEQDALKSKEISELRKRLEDSKNDGCQELDRLKSTLAEMNKEREMDRCEMARLRENVADLSSYKEDEEKRKVEAEKSKKKLEETAKKGGCGCGKKIDLEKAKMKERMSNLQKEAGEKERCATEKCNNLKCQLEETNQLLKETEERLDLENGELRALAEELTSIILKQKNRIEEMVGLSNKHKEIVDAQARTVECKNQELNAVEEELVALRKRYEELESHLQNLSSSMQNDMMINRCNMERELDALNKILEEETHKLHIKEKIVEDQANTISQLKKKLGEKDDNVAMLYKELNFHKREKNEMNTKIAQLNEEKKSLAKDFIRAQNDLERQHVIMENLEKKLVLQHREWELQTEIQVREKEKALTAAHFATAKLIETMHDFQKQTESQNQVRNALATLLQEKDDKLRSAIMQISSLTYDPEMVMRVAQNCDLVKGMRAKNDATDSNDSFASCRGSFRLETQPSVKSSSDSSRTHKYIPGVWYQINPSSKEDFGEEIEEEVLDDPRCFCASESGPFDTSGAHLQADLGIAQRTKLICGCKPVCKCGLQSRSQPIYPD